MPVLCRFNHNPTTITVMVKENRLTPIVPSTPQQEQRQLSTETSTPPESSEAAGFSLRQLATQ